MNRVYTIKPGSDLIKVSDGRTLQFKDHTAPTVVLTDILGDEELAKKYLRFRWRWPMFDGWAVITVPHGVTETLIRQVIDEIEKTRAETRGVIAKMSSEKPQAGHVEGPQFVRDDIKLQNKSNPRKDGLDVTPESKNTTG